MHTKFLQFLKEHLRLRFYTKPLTRQGKVEKHQATSIEGLVVKEHSVIYDQRQYSIFLFYVTVVHKDQKQEKTGD